MKPSQMKNYSRWIGGLIAILFAVGIAAPIPARGQVTILNFDDGTDGAYIGGFYGSSGVIFSNAYWFPNLSRNTGQPFDGASPGAFCFDRYAPDSNNGFPQIVYPSDPIIVLFTAPVTNVTVIALDVGDAGAEMDAYDSVVGGNLVATNQVFGGGIGVSSFFTLTNSAAAISRVEIYQPAANGSDGIVFDTLTCAPSPLLASVSLGISASGAITIQSYMTGLSNRVEYVSSIGSTNWTTLTNFVLTSSPFTVVDPEFGQFTQRFYRAVTLP